MERDLPDLVIPSIPAGFRVFRASSRDAGALLLLALVANFVRIGVTSIGLDEAASMRIAHGSLRELFHVITGRGPNMGLYYVLLSFWVRVFGESEAAARSLSAIFAALAVPVIYLLAANLFGRTAGLAAGLLLALNALVVQFAQTARSYALLVLLVTLSSYFFVLELERPSSRNRVGYVLTGVLAFHAHYFAAYVLAAHAIALLAIRGRGALTRDWLGMAVAISVLCAPQTYFAYSGHAIAGINWISRPTLRNVGPVFVDFAGGSRLLLLSLLALGSVATVSGFRNRLGWRYGFVAAWLLVPVVLSFAVSMVKPMFLTYYLIICVPALVLFGAAGIARLRPRIVGGLVAGLLAVLSATRLAALYSRESSENWRDAAHAVLGDQRSDDGIIFFPYYARGPFDYYVRQRGIGGPENLGRDPLSGGQRVWLAIRASDSTGRRTELEKLRSSLNERYHLSNKQAFRGVAVEEYVRY